MKIDGFSSTVHVQQYEQMNDVILMNAGYKNASVPSWRQSSVACDW